MKLDPTLTSMLKRAGATLLREKNHYVWQLPNGQRFVFSKTPSDARALKNAVGQLRRLLGEQQPPLVKVKRRPQSLPLPLPSPVTPSPVALAAEPTLLEGPREPLSPTVPPTSRFSLPEAVVANANRAFKAGGAPAYNAYLKEYRMNPQATAPAKADLGELTIYTQKAIADQKQQIATLEGELRAKQAEVESKKSNLKLLTDFLEALTLTLETAKQVQGLLVFAAPATHHHPPAKAAKLRRTNRTATANRLLAFIHEGKRVRDLHATMLDEFPTLTLAGLYALLYREKRTAQPRFGLVNGWVKKL